MRTTESDLLRPIGMDRSPQPVPQSFYLAENVTFDPVVQAWTGPLGIEPYDPLDQGSSASFFAISTHTSIFEFDLNGVTYLLAEQQGIEDASKVRLVWYAQGYGRNFTILDDRTFTEGGSVYVQVQDWAVVLNGVDQPIKVGAYGQVTPFGFIERPSPPSVFGVDPARMAVEGIAPNYTDFGIAPYPAFHLDQTAWAQGLRYQREGDSAPGTEYDGPKPNTYLGLGTTNVDDVNTYGYRVAFVSESGAISALSDPVKVSWTVPPMYDDEAGDNGTNIDEGNNNPSAVRYACYVSNLPRGPLNTAARYLYRTRNLRDGILGAGEEYFLAAIIPDNVTDTFTDFTPDSELISLAPTPDEAWTVDSGHTTGAVWDGRLWLSGSASNPERVYYSARGSFEQFGLTRFIEVSQSQGGPVRALVSYQNMLLVLRENSTEVITKGQDGYTLSTLHSEVGTLAKNGAVQVPGGVMFCSRSGIWLVSGNLETGAGPTLTKLSGPIDYVFDRINWRRLASAQAAYSHKWREAWFHVPVDDSTVPNLGLVFHLETGGWSLRGYSETDEPLGTKQEELPVWNILSLTCNREGEFLLGVQAYGEPNAEDSETTDLYGGGISVLSRSGTIGFYAGSSIGPELVTMGTWTEVPVYSSLMTSWTPVPKDKVQMMHLELSMFETGREISCAWMTDGKYQWTQSLREDPPSAPTKFRPLHPDDRNTDLASPLWGPLPSGTRPLGVVDETRLTDSRFHIVRVDLNPNVRDQVLVYLRTAEAFELVGWAWSFNATRVKQRRG